MRTYILPDNKNVVELHDELVKVWNDYPEYKEKPFMDMVKLFAKDGFYRLHLVAISYMEQL